MVCDASAGRPSLSFLVFQSQGHHPLRPGASHGHGRVAVGANAGVLLRDAVGVVDVVCVAVIVAVVRVADAVVVVP